jgi:hypothetical protein
MLKWILVGIGICLYWTIEGLHLLYQLLTGGDVENSRKTRKTKVLKYWWCWQWELYTLWCSLVSLQHIAAPPLGVMLVSGVESIS